LCGVNGEQWQECDCDGGGGAGAVYWRRGGDVCADGYGGDCGGFSNAVDLMGWRGYAKGGCLFAWDWKWIKAVHMIIFYEVYKKTSS